MATMNVLDAAGSTVAVEKPLAPGRAAASASRPVALSNEDAAFRDGIEGQLTTLATKLDSVIAAVDGLEGFTDGLETAIASTNTKLDTLNTAVASTADTPVESHQPADVIPFTPAIDTTIYAAGDVLFVTTLLSGITRVNDGRANLFSLTAIDKAKQNAAITLLFYQTNVTSAALNAANAMSDADQLSLMGSVDIAAADWKTWANNSTLCYSGAKAPNLLLEAVSGGTGVYIVGIVGTGSTPTYATAGDLVFKFGVVQA